MFVYSVRASSVRFFAAIALVLVLLLVFVSLGGTEAVSVGATGPPSYRYDGIREGADRIEFLAQFGIEVNETPIEEETFTMPEDFDHVLRGYNEVQKAQGLDLSKYVGKKLTRYTYEVTNASCEGTVYATVLVHRRRVVAADVSSADPSCHRRSSCPSQNKASRAAHRKRGRERTVLCLFCLYLFTYCAYAYHSKDTFHFDLMYLSSP